MGSSVWFGILALVSVLHNGSACSCMPTSLEKKYCNADFVLKVRVRSDYKSGGDPLPTFDGFFRIKIKQKWKFRFEELVANQRRVYTASDGGMCGSYLQKGKTYLISGVVDKQAGKMTINLCMSITQPTPFPSAIMKLKSNPPNCLAIANPDKDIILAPRK